jgi:hypothetical protein
MNENIDIQKEANLQTKNFIHAYLSFTSITSLLFCASLFKLLNTDASAYGKSTCELGFCPGSFKQNCTELTERHRPMLCHNQHNHHHHHHHHQEPTVQNKQIWILEKKSSFFMKKKLCGRER